VAVDWEGLWRERKRLILSVAGGIVVLLLGESVVHALYAKPLSADQRTIARAARRLHSAAPTRADVAAAEAEAEEAEEAVRSLRERILFHVREAYTLPQGDPHPTVRYVDTVDRTLEELASLSRRRGMPLPDSLGFPQVAPSDAARIEGLLSALDGVERAVRLAVETGVAEIESVRVVDDTPRFSKDGPGIGVQEIKLIANGDAATLFPWMQTMRQNQITFGLGRVESIPRKGTLLRAELTLRLLLEPPPEDEDAEEGG